MVRFVQDWITWWMETPEEVDRRAKEHLAKVEAGADNMRAGWAAPLLPRGFWNAPFFTSKSRAESAGEKGFPTSVYSSALDDMQFAKRRKEEDGAE